VRKYRTIDMKRSDEMVDVAGEKRKSGLYKQNLLYVGLLLGD